MAINEFKPFAATADANVQEQADYEQSDTVRSGFRNGLARSAEVNKAIRQASSITAAIAEFTAEKSGKDMLDDGDIAAIKTNFETALSAVSTLLIAQADGDADALTASFAPEVKVLKNGLMVHVRAKEKNLTKAPGFKADATAAKTIVKGNNLALTEGDIAGAGHWLEMQYDESLDKWVLLNPAKGITPQSGVPVGTIEYFAMATPPAGYLKADGKAVGRETYRDLFTAIGTTFGEGDGETTFNLPDLINRFAQGSTTPGKKIEAGLPNVTGQTNIAGAKSKVAAPSGAYTTEVLRQSMSLNLVDSGLDDWVVWQLDLSKSNPIYGSSSTVQPPALTLLPCIKAFDVVTNPGLIDVTELARQVNYLNGIILLPVPAGGLDLYLSNDGSDANDGMSQQKAFASLERAFEETRKYVRNSHETIVIHVAAGTYHTLQSDAYFLADMSVYYPRIRIEGEGDTSVFSASIYVNNFGTLHLKNLRIIITDRPHACAVSTDGGVMLIEDCRLEAYNTGNALMKASYGRLKAVSNIWLGGSGISSAIRVDNMGFADIHQATLNLITNPTFNFSTISLDTAGYLYAHGSLWTGTSVGKKYQVDCNGICYTLSGNNFFPGTLAGEVAHGGQYV